MNHPILSIEEHVIKHLVNNDGSGIIVETEADTISNSLRQEWGSFSDLIRKSFQSC